MALVSSACDDTVPHSTIRRPDRASRCAHIHSDHRGDKTCSWCRKRLPAFRIGSILPMSGRILQDLISQPAASSYSSSVPPLERDELVCSERPTGPRTRYSILTTTSEKDPPVLFLSYRISKIARRESLDKASRAHIVCSSITEIWR